MRGLELPTTHFSAVLTAPPPPSRFLSRSKSTYGLTCDVWNTLHLFEAAPRISSVTVLCALPVVVMVNSPSNFGASLCTIFLPDRLLSSQNWFLLESITLSPQAKGKLSLWCLFAEAAWFTLASSKLSPASVATVFILSRNCKEVSTVSIGSLINGGMTHGEMPSHNWKPEYPVEAFAVFIIENRMCGNAETQPCWLWSTWKCNA